MERVTRRVGSVVLAGVVLLLTFGTVWEATFWHRWGIMPALPYMQASVLLSATAVFVGGWLLARRGAVPGGSVLFSPRGRHSLGVFCLNPLVIAGFDKMLKHVPLAVAPPPWVLAASPLASVPLVVLVCCLLSRGIDRAGAGILVK